MNLYALNMIGVAVFAASGAIAAGRKHFDLMGVAVISVVTAIGGGTLRDLLLGRLPVFWIQDPNYIWVALGAALLTIAHARIRKPPTSALLIADALGLALFAMGGAQLTEERQLHGIIVVMMGAMTGVAGGIVRDVLTGEVPLLFRNSETLYATAAIVGISLYLALQTIAVDRTVAAYIGMAAIAALRFVAIFWHVRLPAFRLPNDAQ